MKNFIYLAFIIFLASCNDGEAVFSTKKEKAEIEKKLVKEILV